MLPLSARVDPRAVAIKGYTTLPKAPALLEPYHQIVLMSYPGHSSGESYSSAKKQSVYSLDPADWVPTLKDKVAKKVKISRHGMQYLSWRQLEIDTSVDKKRARPPKVTTIAEDKHLIIGSKRDKMKTASELTVELNSFWQPSVFLSAVKNQQGTSPSRNPYYRR